MVKDLGSTWDLKDPGPFTRSSVPRDPPATSATRHWRLASVLLFVLADGALALAYRYRGERTGGTATLRAVTVLAVIAAVFVIVRLAQWRLLDPWVALATLTFIGTGGALTYAWMSDPCRWQGCIDFLRDDGFSYWWAAAAGLATASLWCFYGSTRSGRRGLWGLRILALLFAMLLSAMGAIATTAPQVYRGGFTCGTPLPYGAPSPDPNTLMQSNSC